MAGTRLRRGTDRHDRQGATQAASHTHKSRNRVGKRGGEGRIEERDDHALLFLLFMPLHACKKLPPAFLFFFGCSTRRTRRAATRRRIGRERHEIIRMNAPWAGAVIIAWGTRLGTSIGIGIGIGSCSRRGRWSGRWVSKLFLFPLVEGGSGGTIVCRMGAGGGGR